MAHPIINSPSLPPSLAFEVVDLGAHPVGHLAEGLDAAAQKARAQHVAVVLDAHGTAEAVEVRVEAVQVGLALHLHGHAVAQQPIDGARV
eukprot:CAMPEP_0118874822 /NCGR_PEP_ID=MMETSP1163-20130328/16122_1 /TAXON_ID=124430 /ORGANISM="Phaeomonas parva, Strain CCMP2877" /LENGTH=89 /DNA_ID=CAMNT_0006810253 /DNA_START=32 /DNA_END=298 /DNA_ORIENTATION=+